MASLIQILVIAAAITIACAQTVYLNDSARDYYHLTRREMQHDVELVELDIAAVEARYADRLDVVQLQQQEVLLEVAHANRTLLTQQALGPVHKYCIQKFDSQLITYNQVKLRQQVCNDKAGLVAVNLTASARSNVAMANFFVNSQLLNAVNLCDKAYPKNQTALELCYVEDFEFIIISFDYYVEKARSELDVSLFNASVASKSAVECSYLVKKNYFENFSKISAKIDNCKSGSGREATAALASNNEKFRIRNFLLNEVKEQ